MPLSEFLRLAVEKLESGQKKQCSTDLSSRTENDLVELVWEDDQIMMQGQSSRVTRNPTLHSLPNTPRVRDAAEGNSTTARIGKFGGVESILNYISPVVPLGHLDLSQNDEMVPWLSYPVNDGLQDYCSELLPEISGVTANGMSARNSFVSGDKGSSCNQEVSNLDNDRDAFKFSSSKARPFCSWPPQQGQTSDPSLGSGVSNIISNNTSNSQDAIFGNCAQGREVVNDSANMKMERQNITLPSNNSSLLNFSHFSRPAILVKAKLPNSGGIPPPVSLGVERMEVKEKGSASRSSNIVKSLLIERLNSTEKDIDFHVPSAPTMVKSGQLVNKQSKVSFLAEGNENLCQEASMKNAKALIQSNTANSTKGVPDGDRGVEPMVASSSVGSGNSADRVSCEQTHNSKRKFHDIEESECHSDDIETESFGVKKPTPAQGVTGSKRSRAAEVHNLSERRRRDRINEKMRALQELIPNCNKIDKASMLDEAIEYLKNLQLQVQMMSMGAGLCMPPMMFPPGTQHMYPAHVPHFSPMGVGMGMGMGFGMGMLDMNGGSPQCPIFPVPPLHGAHFPSSAPGPTSFQRIPGSNLPVYGHASQGLHSSVPRAALVPLTGQPPITSAMGSSALRVSSHSEVPSTSPKLNSEDPVTNKNSQFMHNAEASSSINHRSNQLQASNEVLDQSAPMQENNQATDVRDTAALTSTTATDISKEAGCD